MFAKVKFLILAINSDADLSFLETLLVTFYEIPSNFIQIKRTVTDVLDRIAKLLSKNPNLLYKSYTYLLQGIDDPLIFSKLN